MSKKVRDVTHPKPFYIIHSEVRQQAIVCGLFYEIVQKKHRRSENYVWSLRPEAAFVVVVNFRKISNNFFLFYEKIESMKFARPFLYFVLSL